MIKFLTGECFTSCLMMVNCNSYSVRYKDGKYICHVSEEGPLQSAPEDVDHGAYFFKKGKLG